MLTAGLFPTFNTSAGVDMCNVFVLNVMINLLAISLCRSAVFHSPPVLDMVVLRPWCGRHTPGSTRVRLCNTPVLVDHLFSHTLQPYSTLSHLIRTTVVQTFIIACCNLAFSGGFALQLGALSNSTWAVMNTPTALPGDSQQVRKAWGPALQRKLNSRIDPMDRSNYDTPDTLLLCRRRQSPPWGRPSRSSSVCQSLASSCTYL